MVPLVCLDCADAAKANKTVRIAMDRAMDPSLRRLSTRSRAIGLRFLGRCELRSINRKGACVAGAGRRIRRRRCPICTIVVDPTFGLAAFQRWSSVQLRGPGAEVARPAVSINCLIADLRKAIVQNSSMRVDLKRSPDIYEHSSLSVWIYE
jgi:hypothetical protein